jgi:hypothetical protein
MRIFLSRTRFDPDRAGINATIEGSFFAMSLDYCQQLEPISKMSFGPISLLEPRLKSSIYNSMPPVLNSAPPRS